MKTNTGLSFELAVSSNIGAFNKIDRLLKKL
jgi:hypothetical protein